MRVLLTPRMLGVHALALVLTLVALGLGYWQYDAWQSRRAAEAVDLTAVAPVPLGEVIGPDDPFPGDRIGQPVTLAGDWVPDATTFVSGRDRDGVEGYWVVTPLQVAGGDSALPVVRGWTRSRSDVPAPPEGEAQVLGYLQPPEGTGEADPDPTDDVLPQLRTADLLQRVDQDLYGAYVVATERTGVPTANDGTTGLATATLAQLPPAGRFTALRNLLYAIEWLLFGAFAVFVWWRHVSDAVAAGRGLSTDPVASGP